MLRAKVFYNFRGKSFYNLPFSKEVIKRSFYLPYLFFCLFPLLPSIYATFSKVVTMKN